MGLDRQAAKPHHSYARLFGTEIDDVSLRRPQTSLDIGPG
jgi:hypothetical protein